MTKISLLNEILLANFILFTKDLNPVVGFLSNANSSMKILITVLSVCVVLICFNILFGGERMGKAQDYVVFEAQDDSTQSVIKKKKSPKGAIIRSSILPGLGQWYNEQKIKAILFFSAESYLIGLSIYYNNKAVNSVSEEEKAFYKDKRNEKYWWIGGLTLLSMLDAYIDAHLYDFDTGPDLAIRFGTLHNTNTELSNSKYLGFSLRADF